MYVCASVQYVSVCVCVCVCVCARARARVCVCVCVRARACVRCGKCVYTCVILNEDGVVLFLVCFTNL